MTDDVILDERGVRITTTKAQLTGVTYPVNGITSVRNATESPSFLPVLMFGMPGVLMLMCGGISTFGGLSPTPETKAEQVQSMLAMGLPMLGFGALLTGLAAMVMFTSKPRYFVVVGTAGGDRRGLATRDHDFAVQVRDAIEEAITRRG